MVRGTFVSATQMYWTQTCNRFQNELLTQGIRHCQGWEFAHLLIADSLIALKSNERLWVIPSNRSRQMSNCEQIAQVAQGKWATVSKLLRSLMINDQMSNSLKKFWLKKSKILFLVCFILFFFCLKNERFAHSLILDDQCERIAQVAHQKWAMWAIRSGCSPKVSDHVWFAQVTHQKWANERIARFFSSSLIFLQKTSELFWRAGHICLSTRKRGTLKHKQCLPLMSQNWVLIQNFAVINGDKCFLLKCYCVF